MRISNSIGRLLFLITYLLIGIRGVAAVPFSDLQFKHISVNDNLISNVIRQIYQDREGYIWFATSSGLCQYDGYSIKTYKSNLYTPGLLSNNNVWSLVEDNNQMLWIGTSRGLNVLNKRTGKIRKIENPKITGEVISCLYSLSSDSLLIGTERGLFLYRPQTDSCCLFGPEELKNLSVKTILQDSQGYIWIASWTALHRYDEKNNRLYNYPEFETAYSLFEDSKHRIWAGSWKDGLHLLENPYEDTDKIRRRTFRYSREDSNSLSDNYVYAISEDLNTGAIWVGTRNGLSVMEDEESGRFRNYRPNDSQGSISFNVVSSLMRDSDGIMWIGLLGGGVDRVITHRSDFSWNPLKNTRHEYVQNHSVTSLLVDRNGLLWMGLGSLGFVIYNRQTDSYVYNTDSEDFSFIGRIPTINTIVQSPTTDKIWIGTYDWGVVSYDGSLPKGKRAKLMNQTSDPWLTNCIFVIKEDSKGNTWFGTRNGMSILTSGGKGIRLDTTRVNGIPLFDYSFTAILEESPHVYWTGTSNGGIIRMEGDPEQASSMRFTNYALADDKLNNLNVLCLFMDHKKRLWAGTDGGGLSLFDPEKDRFVPVHEKMKLPGDAVCSIQEDLHGYLWLASNEGLVCLWVPEKTDLADFCLYTTANGLPYNQFGKNAAFTDINGEMFLGGTNGYCSFFPDRMSDEVDFAPIVITDIKVFNQSWDVLDKETQEAISKLAPDFTNQITLNYRQNNFNIEFASLAYANPSQIKYAYYLEGFDPTWQYTDANRRFAYYNNLKPGTYTFKLSATSVSGVWDDTNCRTLQVIILPPPWKSWWAYLLYLCLLCLVVYGIVRFARYRMKLTNALHLAELEQAKMQEVNHLKLQFFTNITHELLTPLTIISAGIEELSQLAPDFKEQYAVMTNHINRLIRLLQQILEFRKAETGNLKLRVSKGDLVGFVKNNVDSFRPLIKKRQMKYTLHCESPSLIGYFDPDKLDKILYNLLSNAAKYNLPGTEVQITLKPDALKQQAILLIKDNGKGLSADEKKNLFKRFYEGNYRKFNTIGTGIGLSLTRDLALLHHGDISVESEVGHGSEFKVVIPIQREAYKEEEIDDNLSVTLPAPLPLDDKISAEEIVNPDAIEEPDISKEKNHTLLLVEDNEDLLGLMVRLLSADFRILSAQTGKEALYVMDQEEIDLIVSDIMMPEMDGIEFCKRVKGELKTCHIPIILLTAKTREEDRVDAYNSGAEGFITKPFNLSVLHAKINNLLKAKERGIRDFKNQLVFEAQDLNYTSMDEDFLQRTIDLIHAHLSDPELDQQMFLDELGLSKSTFYRKIKSLTGLSLSTFIRNIRLKSACRIMEDKKNVNMRISELAYAVGFNDPKYFSVCFKKEFGMLPGEYMERFVQGDGS